MGKCIVFVLWLLLCWNAEAKTKHFSSCATLLCPTHTSLLLQNQKIKQMGLERISNERRLLELVEDGTLVALPNTDAVIIAPSLPSNRRYVLPMTRDFLQALASEYYAEFHLPLQVNSAVRTKDVQRKLRRYNRCAAPVDGEYASSHETGATIDLSRRLTKQQLRWLEWRLLYYYGRNKVLVEEERHCFHIMVVE
jgi:Family of unknown function (DUF5715)